MLLIKKKGSISSPNKKEGPKTSPNKEERSTASPNKKEGPKTSPNKEERSTASPNKKEGSIISPNKKVGRSFFLVSVILVVKHIYQHAIQEIDGKSGVKVMKVILQSSKIEIMIFKNTYMDLHAYDEIDNNMFDENGNRSKDIDEGEEEKEKAVRVTTKGLLCLTFQPRTPNSMTSPTPDVIKILKAISDLLRIRISPIYFPQRQYLVYPTVPLPDDPENVDENNINDLHQNESRRVRLSGMSTTQEMIHLHNLATHRRSYNALTLYEDSSIAVTGRRYDIPMVQRPPSSGYESALSLLTNTRFRSADFSFSLRISSDMDGVPPQNNSIYPNDVSDQGQDEPLSCLAEVQREGLLDQENEGFYHNNNHGSFGTTQQRCLETSRPEVVVEQNEMMEIMRTRLFQLHHQRSMIRVLQPNTNQGQDGCRSQDHLRLSHEPVSPFLPHNTQQQQDRCHIHDTSQLPQQPVCRVLNQNTEQGHSSTKEAVKIDESKCQLTGVKELTCTLETNKPMPSTSGTCQVSPSTNKTTGHGEGKHQDNPYRSNSKETRAGVQVNVTHQTSRSDNSAETQEDLDERPTESTSTQAADVDFPRRSAGENEESNGNGNQYGSYNRIQLDLDSGIGSCLDPTYTDRSYHSNPEREIDGSFDIMQAFGFGHEPWEIGDGLSNNDDDPHELEIHGDIHVPREIGEMSFTTEPMPNRLSRETMESQLPRFEQLLPAVELEIETSSSDIKDEED